MSHRVDKREASEWTCGKCGEALKSRTVEVAYMGSKYPVELPRCPLLRHRLYSRATSPRQDGRD